MRNLIIIISVLFVTIIAVSYFYFSNLAKKDVVQLPEHIPEETIVTEEEPQTSYGA